MPRNNNNGNNNRGGGGGHQGGGGGNHGGGNHGGGVGGGQPAGGGGGGHVGNNQNAGNNHNNRNHGGGGNGGGNNNRPGVAGNQNAGNNHGNNRNRNHGGGNRGGNGGAGNGGTEAPIPVSSWTNNYEQWKKEHPNPGHSPGARSGKPPAGAENWNENYHAWLRQHPNPGHSRNNRGNGGTSAGRGRGHGNGSGGTAVPGGNPGAPHNGNGGTAAPGHHGRRPNGNGNGGTSAGTGGVIAEGDTGPLHAAVAVGNNARNGGRGQHKGNGNGGTAPGAVSGDTIGATGGVGVGDGGTSAGTGGVSQATNAAAGSARYRVKQGDTLSGIAAAQGVSLDQLVRLNPQIKNPDMIFTGQNINLGKGHVAGAGTGGVGAPLPGQGRAGGNPGSVQAGLDNVRRQHGKGGGHPPDGTRFVTAPVVNELGGGGFGAGAPDFPTTSTYPPVEQSLAQNSGEAKAGRFRNLGRKIKGWGFGKPPADPAQNAVYVDIPRNTNPLDIKDGKGHGGPRPPA